MAPLNGDAKIDPSLEVGQTRFLYETKVVTTSEWIRENVTNDLFGKTKRYFIGLFPIFSWIYRYNLTWAIGGMLSISTSQFLTLLEISSPV